MIAIILSPNDDQNDSHEKPNAGFVPHKLPIIRPSCTSTHVLYGMIH